MNSPGERRRPRESGSARATKSAPAWWAICPSSLIGSMQPWAFGEPATTAAALAESSPRSAPGEETPSLIGKVRQANPAARQCAWRREAKAAGSVSAVQTTKRPGRASEISRTAAAAMASNVKRRGAAAIPTRAPIRAAKRAPRASSSPGETGPAPGSASTAAGSGYSPAPAPRRVIWPRGGATSAANFRRRRRIACSERVSKLGGRSRAPGTGRPCAAKRAPREAYPASRSILSSPSRAPSLISCSGLLRI